MSKNSPQSRRAFSQSLLELPCCPDGVYALICIGLTSECRDLDMIKIKGVELGSPLQDFRPWDRKAALRPNGRGMGAQMVRKLCSDHPRTADGEDDGPGSRGR